MGARLAPCASHRPHPQRKQQPKKPGRGSGTAICAKFAGLANEPCWATMRPSKNPSLNLNLAKLQQPSHTALPAAYHQLFARPTRPGPPWAATMRRPRGKVRPGPWPELPTLWAGLAMLTPPAGWATRAKARVACDPARPAAQHTKTAARPPCRPGPVFVHCASGFLWEQLPPYEQETFSWQHENDRAPGHPSTEADPVRGTPLLVLIL